MAGQVKDVGLSFLLSLVLAFAVYGVGRLLPLHPYVTMLVQMLLYAGLYLLVSQWLKPEGYTISREIIRKKLLKRP